MARYTGPDGDVDATQAHQDTPIFDMLVRRGSWIVKNIKTGSLDVVEPEWFEENYRQVYPRIGHLSANLPTLPPKNAA